MIKLKSSPEMRQAVKNFPKPKERKAVKGEQQLSVYYHPETRPLPPGKRHDSMQVRDWKVESVVGHGSNSSGCTLVGTPVRDITFGFDSVPEAVEAGEKALRSLDFIITYSVSASSREGVPQPYFGLAVQQEGKTEVLASGERRESPGWWVWRGRGWEEFEKQEVPVRVRKVRKSA